MIGGAANDDAPQTFRKIVLCRWSRNPPLLWGRKAGLDGLEAVVHFPHQLLQFMESLGHGTLIIPGG
jgi:hypothetical protein